MALINCPECSAQFSDYASACPKCGCPTSIIKERIKQERYSLASEIAAKPLIEKRTVQRKKIKLNKKWTLILSCLSILLIIGFFLLAILPSDKKTYDSARELALEGKYDDALVLFSQLPEDYAPKSDQAWAGAWVEGITECYDSPFIGTWKNGSYILEITMNVSGSRGVYLEYDKEYTSPGGVLIWDYGKMGIEDDLVTAYFYNSKESNAKNYTLVLVDASTIDVYFDGIHGYNKEITLYKRK